MGKGLFKQCSSIRSSLAMLITSVVAGYLTLPSGWRRVVLIPAVVPITIFKNAVRITTITLLSIYVDGKFLTDSWLHHSRGDRLFCNRAGAACVGYLGFEMAPEKGIRAKSFTDGCRKDSVIEKSEVQLFFKCRIAQCLQPLNQLTISVLGNIKTNP